MKKKANQIIIYTTEDGNAKFEVSFDNETAWLTQKQMADLFDCSVDNVALHLKNIYAEKELEENRTSEESSVVQKEGHRAVNRLVKLYNLDAIISIGYRINSLRGTQFRIWATQRLREYIIKGFVLDDERMKQGGDRARYFEELLQRIRDIRSSERNFYQKVTDIYATSIDYKKDTETTKQFFATVQNKMHFAVHGHTAAEIITKRADCKKPLMGLTSFKGSYVTAYDTRIAKNYLSEKEIKQLNLIVSLYLDFAELQASNERPMKMLEWIGKLDEFLKLSEKKILTNAGRVSTKVAEEKAGKEFEKYRKNRDERFVSDFDQEVKKLLSKKLQK
ncbi:MAG: virulence RhuM family protein [Candidatus Moraniibacteriota bacterium]